MNCELCKARMSDAAMDLLSMPERAEFAGHIQACGGCGREFGRVQALLQTIDSSVMTQAAAEPSPDFIRQVRIRIAAESAPAHPRWGWWAPAAACATVVIIAIAMWLVWPRDLKPGRVVKTGPASVSSMAGNHSAPSSASGVASTPREIEAIRPARPAAMRRRGRTKHEQNGPEVIIPPGETRALLQLADVLQSGKLDGGKLLADLNRTDQLIEIKPLVIPPLEPSPQADDAGSGPGGNGERKNVVSRVLTQEIAP